MKVKNKGDEFTKKEKKIWAEVGDLMYDDYVKEHSIRFRSWNEESECFVYFEDGNYSDFIPFNWQNAEQEITRNGVTFFEGDKFIINSAVYGVIAIKNGILGFDIYEFNCDDYRGFNNINRYNIQSMEKIGNIHEVKDGK